MIVAKDKLNVDQEVLRAATVFHDLVNLSKDSPDRTSASRRSAQAAVPLLRDLGLKEAKVVAVVHAIEAHSFSAGIQPCTIEAKVLRDADRLDALGAVGLARLLYVGATLGRDLYDPDDPLAKHRALDDGSWTIDHLETKLFGLADDMQTQAGRILAKQRTDYLRQFRDTLLKEL